MYILKFLSYFHDGSIYQIYQENDKIFLSMGSAVIEDSEPVDRNILTTEGTIRGTLVLNHIRKIKINDVLHNHLPKFTYDDCEILNLEISEDTVKLFVQWINFPPKSMDWHMEPIELTAEKIEWVPQNPSN